MSKHDDPFGFPESERTIIMPSPGGRAVGRDSTASNGGAWSSGFASADESAPPVAGMNPLVAAANPLLNIVPQLRATLDHPDSSGLRDYLVQNIQAFETRAKAAGVAAQNVIAARYILCTMLDETAASTPWGGSGIWAKQSLLVTFHNESWGGEKFFQLLSKLAENPAANRDVLELMYACLALGFEGRYRVLDNGAGQLELLRERLAEILRKTSGEYERELSPRWQGVTVERSKILDALPFWIAAGISAAIMLTAYIGFRYKLSDISDPAYSQIAAIRVNAPTPVAAPAAVPRLATFLAKEISAGLVTVRDEENKSVVSIRGDGLFEPGNANISTEYFPLLEHIAGALKSVKGQVQIIGHTDNKPIRSLRFPSNWHLSEERARSVMRLLAQTLPIDRLSAEGRADAEPIADNDSVAGRSRNRRVEITLLIGGKRP